MRTRITEEGELEIIINPDDIEYTSINKNDRGIYIKLNRPLTPNERIDFEIPSDHRPNLRPEGTYSYYAVTGQAPFIDLKEHKVSKSADHMPGLSRVGKSYPYKRKFP